MGPIGSHLVQASDKLVGEILKLTPTDELIITCDSSSDWDVVRAVAEGVSRVGSKYTVLTTEPIREYGLGADAYIPGAITSSILSADYWIELNHPPISQSMAWRRAMDAGRVKHLLCAGLYNGAFVRIFAGLNLKAMAKLENTMASIVGKGKIMRIRTPAGTDVVCELAPNRVYWPSTSPLEPGRVNFIPGNVTLAPVEETIRGTIVLETTEGIPPEFYSGRLTEPIVLKVDGKIRSIDGTGAKVRFLRDYLRKITGGDFGYIIHMTYGLHPKARGFGRNLLEDMREPGANSVGFGYQWRSLKGEKGEMGGEAHANAVIFNQSLWIDELQIADRGDLVGPQELLEAARELYG